MVIVRNGITAAAKPARLTSRSASPNRNVAPGPLRDEGGCAPSGDAQRLRRLGDDDHRQHHGVDAEQHDEVEREEGERPAEARLRVEPDRQRPEDAERDPGRAERQTAAPVQPQPLPRVGEREVAGADERHRRVRERHGQRPREHGQHEQRVHRDRRNRREHEHRSERRVDWDEPPRVPIQVGDRESESTTRAHPFTPAETTPDTKKRWKARKMIRIGRIAMMAPAEISGHSDAVVEVQLREPELKRVVVGIALSEQDQGPEEVVPDALELEDGERRHRGQRERQHHAPERLEVAGAVELRRLFEVASGS